MQVIFFATPTDVETVWRILFDTPGMRIVEEYSVPDQPNRWVEEWSDLLEILAAGQSSLAAWPSAVGGIPVSQRITFTPEARASLGARGRTILHSAAFIRLHRNADQNGCLAASSMSCWEERGAKQRSIAHASQIESIDWKAFRSVTAKVQRQLRKIAPARLHSYPILPDAFAKLSFGQIKLWNWGSPCSYPSTAIVLV